MSDKTVKIFLLCLFLLTFNICNAQTKKDSSVYVSMTLVIKQQADSMGYYLTQNDFTNYMKYQHPALVKKLGGEQMLLTTLKNNTDKGMKVLSETTDAPSKIIVSDTNLQSTLSQTSVIFYGNKKLEIISSLICISYDNGGKWFFINASGLTDAILKEILPEKSSELIIQEQRTKMLDK